MSDELDELLRSMPRERAPEGFARDVVARLERPRRGRPTWRLAAAGALAAAVAVGATWLIRSSGEQRALRAEIAALRAQHQRLEGQLTELRQKLAEPRIVVGGNDHVDYILDLDRLSAGFQTANDGELIWVPPPATEGSL